MQSDEHDDGVPAEDPAGEDLLASERMLQSWRAEIAPVAFDAGFPDRVMQRLARDERRSAISPASRAVVLTSVFWRLAPLAAAAVVLIGTMNILNSQSETQPFIDRALGLPAVTVAAAYSLDGVLEATLDGQQR